MDKINPFTNAPTPAPGQPPVTPPPPVAQKQPPKSQDQKSKREFSIKPYIKAAVMIIIGVVVAKLAFDSVIPMLQQPQKTDTKTIKSTAPKPAVRKAAIPAKAATPVKGKKGEQIPLSDQFAAAKKAAKSTPPQTIDEFTLNGIFLSETDGMSSAIVNNKVVQVGDTVDGAVVTSITIEGLELHKDDQVIKLRNK